MNTFKDGVGEFQRKDGSIILIITCVFRDGDIRWTRPLHEYITGCKTYPHLPPHEELSLYHPKTIEKQEKQNLFYNQNFSRELNVRR